jgi:hypothetical protein
MFTSAGVGQDSHHPKLSGKNGVGSYATVHQKLVRAAPEPFAEPNVQIAKAANNPFSNTVKMHSFRKECINIGRK